MKKQLRFITLLVLLCLINSSYANKLIVESFKHNPADLEAKLFERKDELNQPCAIIKIMTSIEGLTFETGKPIVGPVVTMPGEYWIYVSPGEKLIRILKEGYSTLEVSCVAFNLKFESSSVYAMTLKSEDTPKVAVNNITQKGDFKISSDPQGATILLDEDPAFKGVTPYLFKKHPAGVYRMTLQKEHYNDKDLVFQVVPDTVTYMNVPLVQSGGFIVFNVKPVLPEADFYIDGRLTPGIHQNEMFPVSAGTHKIVINSPNWISESKDVTIELGETDSLTVNLKPILGKLAVKMSPSNVDNVEIWLNNKKTGHFAPDAFPLQTGDYSISLMKKDYPAYTRNFTMKEGQNLELKFTMRTIVGLKRALTIRRLKQNIWMASAIGTGVAGLYLIGDSNKKNLEYKTAVGSDANRLHSQIESNRKTAVIALGVAVFSAVEFSVQIFKKEKEKKWLSVGSDGQRVGLKANF